MTANERFLATITLVALFAACVVSFDYYHDLPGPHCGKRDDPCCLHRQDDCGVPLAGGLLNLNVLDFHILLITPSQVPSATVMSSVIERLTATAAQTTYQYATELVLSP